MSEKLAVKYIEKSEKLAVKYIEKSDWHVLCPTIDMHKRSTYHMSMEGGISVIIDSHAHYNNSAYKKPFRYLSYDKDGYSLKEGELPQLMQEMDDADIRYFICHISLIFAFATFQNSQTIQLNISD